MLGKIIVSGSVLRLNFKGVIMHPGPMNRGLEIDDCVADVESSPHNLILSQVTSGVATRMAILEHLIG